MSSTSIGQWQWMPHHCMWLAYMAEVSVDGWHPSVMKQFQVSFTPDPMQYSAAQCRVALYVMPDCCEGSPCGPVQYRAAAMPYSSGDACNAGNAGDNRRWWFYAGSQPVVTTDNHSPPRTATCCSGIWRWLAYISLQCLCNATHWMLFWITAVLV